MRLAPLHFAQNRRPEAQSAAVLSVGRSWAPPAKERAVGLSWTDFNVRAVVGSENACAVVDISAGHFKKGSLKFRTARGSSACPFGANTINNTDGSST